MNKNELNVLWIVPSKRHSPLDMLFAKRGTTFLKGKGINVLIKNFYESKSIVGMIKEIFLIRKMVAENNIHIVHAHYGSTTAFVTMLTFLPYVITFRGSDINGDPGASKFSNILRKGLGIIAANFSKATICVSSELKNQLGPFLSGAYIIPSGTKIELFHPIDKIQARNQLSLETTKIFLGFASGGGRKVKRPDLAAQVCKELQKRGYNAELLVIWNIDHDRVPLYINASDVVILTSEKEGSPNIVRESLACGVPFVAFNVGDVLEWAKLDPFSVVLNDRSVIDMANEVEKILISSPTRERRVNVNLFSEESSALKLANIYKTIH